MIFCLCFHYFSIDHGFSHIDHINAFIFNSYILAYNAFFVPRSFYSTRKQFILCIFLLLSRDFHSFHFFLYFFNLCRLFSLRCQLRWCWHFRYILFIKWNIRLMFGISCIGFIIRLCSLHKNIWYKIFWGNYWAIYHLG